MTPSSGISDWTVFLSVYNPEGTKDVHIHHTQAGSAKQAAEESVRHLHLEEHWRVTEARVVATEDVHGFVVDREPAWFVREPRQ